VIIALGRRLLRPIMVVMRATGVMIVASGVGNAGMCVRMAQSADDAINRLQSDGEEGDEDVTSATHR